MKIYLLIISLFFCSISFAQTSVTGSVKDSSNQPIPGANITVSGENSGTVTDNDGNFILTTSKKAPFEVKVSSIGYGMKTMTVTSNNQKIAVVLNDEETMLDEIIVSASRTPERLRESPVTIERFTAADVRKSASPSFYDGLENMKEVQMNTSSMSFKSINTRGFATVANTRFMQLVDGMDNSSPLLNFVLGNLIGVSEIDVASVELLPGASSALYGANAFNGILFMKSKSPFIDQGVSAYAKYGQTSQKAAGNNLYYDYGVRVAHKFNDHFAAKANFTFMNGTDWFATDYSDKTVEGRDRSHHNYNGMNVYGDEASANLKSVAQGLLTKEIITPAQYVAFNAILPYENVSRTGYNEVDLTDNKVKNAKVDFSLHFKPFKSDFEIIWQSKFGMGNSVYQGANRYYLNGFQMQQHKLELTGKNFFVRGYFTTEDGGSSYDMLFTGLNISRAAKPDNTWFGEYANAYVQSTLAGSTPTQAHGIARNYADYNIIPSGLPLTPSTGLPRFEPGTPEFQNAFKSVIANSDVLSGSKLVDNSKIYHSDANYNFRDIVKFAEIQVGGSYRRYDLNSFGRIYTDTPQFGGIKYDEYGAYTQIQKKLMDDRLKLAGSVRYDKSDNFDGNYSPRVSAVYSAGESKNHVFRGSFQTGFRNPATQDQYIGFNVGTAILLGSAKDNLTRYQETLDVNKGQDLLGFEYAGGTTSTINGYNAYFNSYTATSVQAFAAFASENPGNVVGATSLLRKTDINLVKPEKVKAFELGYRGQYEGFNIDVNGYYNVYNDFIGNLNVVAPLYGTASNVFDFTKGAANTIPYLSTDPNLNNPEVQSLHALQNSNTRTFQLYTNTDLEIKSLGFGVGLSRKLVKDFELSANYNYAQFDFDQAKDPSFEAGFNTPKHRVKGSISGENVFKNLGFNLSVRWSDEYMWESTFADGMIDAATVVDAQVSYGLPKLKSILKVGAANLGGKEYRQLLGPGLIGQQYFVSLTINP